MKKIIQKEPHVGSFSFRFNKKVYNNSMKENIVSDKFKKLRIFLQLGIVVATLVYVLVYFLVTDFPPREWFSNKLYTVMYVMIPVYLVLIGILIRFCCAKKLKRAEVVICCILNIAMLFIILNMTYQMLWAINDIRAVHNPYDPILNPTEYHYYLDHLEDVSFPAVVYFIFGTFLLRWAVVGLSIAIVVFSLLKPKHRAVAASSQQHVQITPQNGLENSTHTSEDGGINSELQQQQKEENCFIFCAHCGKRIKKDAKFCMYCGKSI